MVELEQQLQDLADAVDWPDGDHVAAAVGERLRADPTTSTDARDAHGQRAYLSHRRGWRVAAAIAVAASVAAVAAIPSSRSAVAGWLGVRGERIEVGRTTLPTAPSAAQDLALGPEVPLADVRAALGFTMPVPRMSGFDRPDEVHVAHPPTIGEALLVYRARPGLPAAGPSGVGMLITAFRADLEPGFFGKVLGPDSRLEQVTVQGLPGYWIEGAPHQFLYRDASGQVQPETVRLAGNVLLWEVKGITVRIESALSRDEVVRIANAMR